MVAQHFMDDSELIRWLTQDPAFSPAQAKSLVEQVRSRGYSPPRREKVMQWQQEQDFPICPTDDPDGCNIYRNLRFPDDVYRKIGEYHEQKAEARQQ